MKSKKAYSVTLLFYVFFIGFNYQASYAQQSRDVLDKKSLLWEISGNGLEHPSYIFGTVHIIDSVLYFLDEIVEEKLNECEAIVFEVNKNDSEFQQKTMSVLMMKDDSLDNILSSEDYKEVELFFAEKLKQELTLFKKIKPYYLVSFVSSINLPENYKSYEDELILLGKNQNKEILGVSTVERESEILVDRIPLDLQAQMLLDAINDVDKLAVIRDQLIQSYIENDIDKFYKITKNNSDKYEIVFESMFMKRHEVWVPNMIELMNKYSCFFAVGVGHLAGENGILRMLSTEGYSINPL
jgi:uncharacterized protein YbaP (TraB family)